MADISLRELGRLAGTSLAYPSLIESGVRPRVGSDVLVGLARVLGVTLDWLASGTGPEPQTEDVIAAVKRAQEEREQAEAS
jgi:transcriptional regulator with XRE-family HTH domain